MAKFYNKTIWIDEVLSGAEQYHISGSATNLSNVRIELATAMSVTGTLVNATNMNNLETGLDASFEGNHYTISPNISGSTLWISLLRYDSSVATPTAPILFRIGSNLYSITGSVSYSTANGTNWHNAGSAATGTAAGLAGNDIDYFLYAIEETGASAGLKFGHSRIPYAETMNDFSNTSTNEKYIKGNHTNFNSTDKVINIGRFKATLSSGLLWSIPNARVINRSIHVTDWLTWTPSHTRGSTDYTNRPTTNTARYYVDDRQLHFSETHTQNATPGGSGFQQVTLPFTIAQTGMGACLNLNTAGLLSVYCAGTLTYFSLIKYDGNAEAIASNIYASSAEYEF